MLYITVYVYIYLVKVKNCMRGRHISNGGYFYMGKQWIGCKEVADHIWSGLYILKMIAFLTLAKSKDCCHIIFNTSAHPLSNE